MSSTCTTCRGRGVVIEPGRNTAKARPCACQGPCSTCHDTGFLVQERDGRRFRGPCPACHGRTRRMSLFNAAGIPRRFAGKSFENFDAPAGFRNQLERIALRLGPASEGVLLAGAPGVGKTHLLVALLSQSTLDLGLDGIFVDFFALLSELRTAFGRGQSEGDLLDPILDRTIIGIDELGKGKNTEWEASVLDQLVSRAYNTERTLLVTTNYLPANRHTSATRRLDETLEQRVGERVASRLYEMCSVLYIDDVDHRPRGKRL